MDLYGVLGLTRGATTAEIKRAYRRLARRYHPDINPGDRAADVRFRQIAEAYEVLADVERRRRYDERGFVDPAGPDATIAYGFEGFDFSVEGGSGPRASTFGDLFGEVFRRASSRGGDQAANGGADLHTQVLLTFDEAMHGVERQVAVTRADVCSACRGAGVIRGQEASCLHCAGSGMIRSSRGHMVFSKACDACGGTGRQGKVACGRCNGDGIEIRAETIAIRVPAGVGDGARVRVAGKGNVGRHHGRAGDLYATVAVAPHPLFRRDGDDLHIEMPVAIHEAALGARIEVPTIDGPARLRVPPGTQSGQRLRVRGRGAPDPRSDRRGDLIVEVRLVLPRLLDERSKELLREFGRINVEDVRARLTSAP
jgi:molecular chaperone DnaJ